ncbi:MAG TPA: hypothetical protein H9714_10375 [Candidatus Flavonifractor intestinipullorum]|uniref:Uncharacterized protein n=1 Tax=Candidatus Flavonifractor intestinipullorum TaxID=2838587 RepID=A0A9D2S6K5_9FIRM|nr:hypothetical protein [Candidatus Flavonifractor intestinipullorum]
MEGSWFGVGCNIYTHPKVLGLARELKLDVDAAVGKLGRLYAWAAQNGNETGEISYLPPEEIAAIMRWKKRPQTLLAALEAQGLLERQESGLFIHDWEEYNGAFLRKKRRDRERKKEGG